MTRARELAELATAYDSGALSMRNRIINGAMAISQRGASFSSPSNQSYTLDRWKFWADGSGGTLTISQVALSPAELVPFTHAIRINQSAGATSRTYFRINQHIEGLEAFSGQQIAVSFYAKCASGTVASGLRCDRYFGSGGSPSSADNMIYSSGGSPTITTTWTRYTALATVTSTSGKTYGTNNDSSLLVGIDLPTSGTFDVYVTGFQVEYGIVATPFEYRPIGTELALCQRYFYNLVAAAGGASSTTKVEFYYQHPVPMRSAPSSQVIGTMRIEDPAVTSYTQSSGASTIEQASPLGMKLGFPNFTGLTTARPYYVASLATNVTASPPTSVCQISAEL